MKFTEQVLKARPNIKPNSAKAYATSLKLLAPENAENLDFLLDVDAIISKLDKYKHTTRRNYLNAVLNQYKTSKKYGEKKIEIDKDLLKPLRKWLRHNGSEYLLINSKGKPLSFV